MDSETHSYIYHSIVNKKPRKDREERISRDQALDSHLLSSVDVFDRSLVSC